jgi:hypothetical protein
VVVGCVAVELEVERRIDSSCRRLRFANTSFENGDGDNWFSSIGLMNFGHNLAQTPRKERMSRPEYFDNVSYMIAPNRDHTSCVSASPDGSGGVGGCRERRVRSSVLVYCGKCT